MSLSIAATLKDFAFDMLLFGVIKAEKLNDGEGTEHDPLEGTGFEPVDILPSGTSASNPLAIRSISPTASATTFQPGPPSDTRSGVTHNVDTDSESLSEADATALATRKRKRKSKSKIAYQKLAFKKHRAADKQRKKDTLDPDANIAPSLRKCHVASTTPITILIFSLDTKVPTKTGYIGVRDSQTSKKIYKLGELVGETSRFNFNLIEWDGK